MEIKFENAKAAYNAASESVKSILAMLIPELNEQPKDTRPITERVKCWDDVVRELGYDPVERMLDHCERGDGFDIEPDEIAYIKLKAIAKVLNEGWEPKFTTDEYRYFPWFYLYTQEQIDEMTEDERSRVVLRSDYGAHAYGGVACAYAGIDSSSAVAYCGSRLAFKTRELAIYAGQQFVDIWADFVFRPKAKSADASK